MKLAIFAKLEKCETSKTCEIDNLGNLQLLENLKLEKPKTCETYKLRNLPLVKLKKFKLRNLAHVKQANPQSLVNLYYLKT